MTHTNQHQFGQPVNSEFGLLPVVQGRVLECGHGYECAYSLVLAFIILGVTLSSTNTEDELCVVPPM